MKSYPLPVGVQKVNDTVIAVKTSSYKVSPNVNGNGFLLSTPDTKLSLESETNPGASAGPLKARLCLASNGKILPL